jgi:hypothetical protein
MLESEAGSQMQMVIGLRIHQAGIQYQHGRRLMASGIISHLVDIWITASIAMVAGLELTALG